MDHSICSTIDSTFYFYSTGQIVSSFLDQNLLSGCRDLHCGVDIHRIILGACCIRFTIRTHINIVVLYCLIFYSVVNSHRIIGSH